MWVFKSHFKGGKYNTYIIPQQIWVGNIYLLHIYVYVYICVCVFVCTYQERERPSICWVTSHIPARARADLVQSQVLQTQSRSSCGCPGPDSLSHYLPVAFQSARWQESGVGNRAETWPQALWNRCRPLKYPNTCFFLSPNLILKNDSNC